MGIKKLPQLIKDFAGDYAIKSYPFSRFKGMSVSVDASLIIHQTVIALRSTGQDMKNKNGELTSHLHGLFFKILMFLQNDMIPIFVFDGKTPEIKNNTLERRRLIKEEAEKNIQNLELESNEYIKNFKQTFRPTKENIKEALILLDLMGIPYIIAPEEADVVCSWLASRNDSQGKRYVKGVCSDDSDMLAFGARYLFKDMLRFMSKNKPVTVINLNRTLKKMKLTMDQFTDLCVLLGCDYCDNIKGIGYKTAYKLILKHGTLENVIQSITKKKMDPNDIKEIIENEKCMIKARNYFKNALNNLDKSKDFIITDDQLKLRKYQHDELLDFLCVKHDFDYSKVQSGIKRLDIYHKNLNVTRENTKKVHKMIQPHPLSPNYSISTLSDQLDFVSDDDTEIEEPKNKESKNEVNELIKKKD